MANSNQKFFLLTIDVEDWFQVENFKPWIPFDSWPSRELRVEQNTHRILDLLDSLQLHSPTNQSTVQHYPKATFFVLGWIAQRLPNLIRKIQTRGHEIASHGYDHNLCTDVSANDFKRDLTESKKLLEDLIGAPVTGYRAPSFSINDTILKTIQDSGYRYDSSYNSFNLNSRYGKISLTGLKRRGIAYRLGRSFHELPISNLTVKIKNSRSKSQNLEFPWGGGGYFRLLPLPIFKRGIKVILKKQDAYLFFMHPWEIDPMQPRVLEAGPLYRFRHYTNLVSTQNKLTRLINAFSTYQFGTCTQYLNAV